VERAALENRSTGSDAMEPAMTVFQYLQRRCCYDRTRAQKTAVAPGSTTLLEEAAEGNEERRERAEKESIFESLGQGEEDADQRARRQHLAGAE
jgi:hypothetical protein